MRKKVSLIILMVIFLILSGCNNTRVTSTQDKNSPIIMIKSSFQTEYEIGSDEPNWLNAVEVTDEEDGTIVLTESNVDTSNVDMDTLGTFNVIFEVTDSGERTKAINLCITIIQQDGFVKIVAGNKHTMALTSTGRVFTWGHNWEGQLGNGTKSYDTPEFPIEITQNFNLQAEETIVEIVGGDYHNFAISSTGRIFTWGVNWFGGLGDGTTIDRHTPVEITQNFNLQAEETIVEIVARYHNIAISSTGRVFAWGWNDYGQLGDGTTIDRHTPVEITQNFNLQAEETIIEIEHNMAISSTGRVFAWGLNNEGQLGDGTRTNRHTPVEITQNLVNSFFCNSLPCTCLDELLTLDLQFDETYIEIVGRNTFNTVISSTGRVFAVGYHWDLQGGGESILVEITKYFNLQSDEILVDLLEGYEHKIALTSTGRVFTWGMNKKGQLGDGTSGFYTGKLTPIEITQNFNLQSDETIVEIATGDYHNFAISSTGRVFAWGLNKYGQLGDGTKTNSSIPVEITIK